MKFSEWIWGKIGWFISLIVAAILSVTVVNIKEIVLKFEILIGILVIGLFALLLFYSMNFYKDYKRIILSERVPMDAILKKLHKKVIFNDATFTDNEAEVKVHRELYNNMTESNEIYDRFKIEMSSKTDVPHIDDITLIRGDKTIELSELDRDIVKPLRCLEFNSDDVDFSDPLKKKIEFYIPLHLKAGKSCGFEMNYPTKAYKSAIEGREDYIQLMVNRITDELIIEIILEGEMRNQYKISPCVETDGSRLSHKIFDASLERMKRTESRLTEQPEYNDDNAIWKIKNPKIGYNYRMYFKLLPKIRPT